jgi:N4-(beta-N-acetylglucosaminyl)-L-asparaginase
VLEYSAHTLLAGEAAANFSESLGAGGQTGSLTTPASAAIYDAWVAAQCQPNYWTNVAGQNSSCPPYAPLPLSVPAAPAAAAGPLPAGHDTIGLIAIDAAGDVAAGTSTNGLTHKIAGRVGDSPVPGAGLYVDNDVGAAVGTGNGDVMMRFAPTFLAVELMRGGATPVAACEASLARIVSKYSDFQGALLCANKAGSVGAAAWGWTFVYAWASPATGGVPEVVVVPPMPAPSGAPAAAAARR